MTEELKVFEKPDGSLKQTYQLKDKLKRVDAKLSMKKIVENQQIEVEGERFALPAQRIPFAISLEQELMVLWASNEFQRMHWTQAFSSLIKHESANQVQKFQVAKTKKNKFVVAIYNKLMEPVHDVLHFQDPDK